MWTQSRIFDTSDATTADTDSRALAIVCSSCFVALKMWTAFGKDRLGSLSRYLIPIVIYCRRAKG